MIKSVAVKSDRITGKEAAIVVPLYEGARRLSGAAALLDRAVGGAIAEARRSRGFTGKRGQTHLITVRRPNRPGHLLLLGMGKAAGTGAESIAEAGAAAGRALENSRFRSASVIVDESDADDAARFARAFVKGLGLALYSFRISAEKPKPVQLRRLTIHTSARRSVVADAVSQALVTVEYAEVVRDLVNTPAGDLTPAEFADRAKKLCAKNRVACRVIGRAEIERERMGAILAVGRGSTAEPRLVVMHYNKGAKSGRRRLPQVCLVGKGVTFDSGGISIKPWQGMNEMKGDMAGAAVAIATINAAARLELPLEIIAVTPLVENMPDGNSFRPGDIVRTYSGKTIEIFSTDAEGRLILADALTYVRKHFDPAVTVDFATLTGAVLIALGTRIAGVMGNSQKHIDALIEAGREAGEPVWQLPLDDHFYAAVEGDISDYKNYGGRNGSTITAAALLGKFAGDAPWVHVDIAGTYWSDGSAESVNGKGATGYGVDLTLRFLEEMAGGESE
jgi:leucyl aminopeptidase